MAERLDQFMRESEAAAKVFGVRGGAPGAGRDDDAAKNLFQMKSVTMHEFTACVA